ncbi:hypothetical protein GCM10023172_28160 [Hymenobacter ginsengisoli]|uniref:Glycosyltransferase RgtA/B/C/D-like domain-containing protein n=2 Tax=Hymenobacteraceae TaxID=1853232 RepID=A0ABP8QJ53_9BACT
MWPLLAGLVLLHAALYNGFPLVTSDTGTYLVSALELKVPIDRPVTYGLFVRFTSLWGWSVWGAVFGQCLLLGVLLLRYIREFAPRLTHPAGRLALLVLAMWATGVSWFSSQLMPDIFTAIGMLALGLVLLGRCRSGWEVGGWLGVAFGAELCHSSNLVSFNLLVLVMGLVAWLTSATGPTWLPRRRWALTLAVTLAGWLALPTLHAALGGGFTIVRASPAFLIARLSESGVLERFLDHECQGPATYSLCKYRDKLPEDAMGFMWGTNTPMQLAGGMEATRDEYRTIISRILCSPRYYPALAWTATQATLRQLTHVGLGDGLGQYRENTAPFWPMRAFPYELKTYLSSMQNHGQLEFGQLSERVGLAYLLAVVAGLGGLASRAARQRLGPGAVTWLVLVGTALVVNAFATGAVANVYDRLQARMAWLLPFTVLVLATELLLGYWATWRQLPATK